MTLLSLKIPSGPLFLITEKRQAIEDLGSTEPAGCMSMDTTRFLIRLVRDHVSTVVYNAYLLVRLHGSFELQRQRLVVIS